MPKISTYWYRLKSSAVYYVGGVYQYLFEKDIFLWAQAIAFKVLITLVPIVILATGILGRILRREDAFASVADYIQEYIPSIERSNILIDFIEQLQAAGTFFTGLGIFALIFAAMTVFTTLRLVIGNVFQEEWHRHRSTLRGYLFDLQMAGQVGLLFLLTIGLSILAQSLQQGGIEMAQRFSLDAVWLRQGWLQTFRMLSYLIPYMLSTAMFFQLFYFVPQPRPPRRSALVGAVVTGLLWEVAKISFTFYAANVGRFERYAVPGEQGQEIMSVLGEAFGLIIALVFWIYYSGIVLIIGALIAVLNERRIRSLRSESDRPPVKQSKEEVDGSTDAVRQTVEGDPPAGSSTL
ncbi:MAG: YihY/virulence factor BrkB family protein [Rhodothermales bacterium]